MGQALAVQPIMGPITDLDPFVVALFPLDGRIDEGLQVGGRLAEVLLLSVVRGVEDVGARQAGGAGGIVVAEILNGSAEQASDAGSVVEAADVDGVVGTTIGSVSMVREPAVLAM